MARIFERKEGQLVYSASTQSRLQLSRNYHMQYLLLKLKVVHTNSTAVFNDSSLFALINSIEVVANGNQNLKQIPSSKLYLNNVVHTGKEGIKDIKTADGVDLVSYVTCMIPFSLINTIRPYDTILNTAVFSTFDFLVNWGSDATIGSGITVKSATLDVSSSSLVGYKRNASEVIKHFKETSLTEQVTSTTNELTISMPTQKIYKAISIIAMVDKKRNVDMIKGIKIKSGTTVIIDLDADAIKSKNLFEFKPDSTDLLSGVYVIDFLIRGKLSDALNTITDFNTLEVVLDVEKQTGLNNVYVLSDTIEYTNILEK